MREKILNNLGDSETKIKLKSTPLHILLKKRRLFLYNVRVTGHNALRNVTPFTWGRW